MFDASTLFLIGILVFAVVGVFYFVTLIKILGNGDIGLFRKVIWILVLLTIPVAGMLLYYLIEG